MRTTSKTTPVAARLVVPMAVLLGFLAPASVSAQEARPAGSAELRIGGFISGTLYVQNELFGLFTQGQASNTAPPVEQTDDPWFHGGDVRNTRLFLAFERGETDGWSTAAHLELDLFGGWNASEPFGDEMPIPRLRLAYADLTRGNTTIRIGQQWAPILGAVPNSLSHIAFPLGYGSGGVIGWRFPGISLLQEMGGDGVVSKVQVAIMDGSWGHLPGVTAADEPSPGEAGFMPQVEVRVDVGGDFDGGAWMAYVVGHLDQKDPDGVGVDTGMDPIMGTAVQVGGRIRPGNLTVQGNGYYGEAIGQLLGSITQIGDYKGLGAWGQVGYQITPLLSAWGYYGMDTADDGGAPLPNGARSANRILASMLRLDLPGYALGLEWFTASTDYVGMADATSATQFALSVFYSF